MKNSAYDILLEPHVSEKASDLADKYRQFVFKVMIKANKKQIKEAVNEVFKVEVDKVTVVRQKGKKRQFRQVKGCRKDWKKAYVTLKEGFDIEFTGNP